MKGALIVLVQRGQNQNWLPHLCLLRGSLVGGNATSPLLFLGVPNKGDKIKAQKKTKNKKDFHCIPKPA